jgi:hypothetical protein
MKKNDFVALGKRLLPNLPSDFVLEGSLLLIRPVKSVLRGIHFEGSSFDKTSFYAHAFILPLCVPTKFLYFLFGDRLRIAGADRWNINEPNMLSELSATIKREAVPFFSRVQSIRDVQEIAKSHPNPKDPHVQQAIAYAAARSGDVARANEELNRLVRSLDLKIPWQREMTQRAETLKVKLGNSDDAQRQLEAWERETLKNLGLEKFQQ